MKKINTSEQRTQELEYSVPYHYIPVLDGDGFTQTLYWSWGMRYLAGVELVLNELAATQFTSLLDVGCGDGRFLREVLTRFDGKKVCGLDYSGNAVALANALNPGIDYRCVDIINERVDEQYDVVTMVEVLEHIPINDVDAFLGAVAKTIGKNGRLVLTVPHKNKKVSGKHFQHFSSETLRDVLSSHFEVEKIVPFDRVTRATVWLMKMLGGRNYIITNKKINNFVYNKVLQSCLTPQIEENCCRLFAIAKPIV